ncbi:transmembrane inner ear expressed protein [Hypanus sabinus]|uniref:transmembrane inner ear expressed protein n=1 Tax=Hypanus sabinus TaxID=79690 RepID=UPI0028C44682|nr:transmembrane inner ear expressed protein [Hypanus sabinus]
MAYSEDQRWCISILGIISSINVRLSLFISATSSQFLDPDSTTIPPKKPDPVTSETVVFWGLRLWQVVGVFSIFILAVIIVLCCIFKCRIPRTKKEIEARYAQRQAAKKYANTLDNVPPLNELTEMPGAAAEAEKKDEVPTVSASVSANWSKKEVKKKDGQKKDSTKNDRDGSKSKPKDGENKNGTRQKGAGQKQAGAKGGGRANTKGPGNAKSTGKAGVNSRGGPKKTPAKKT